MVVWRWCREMGILTLFPRSLRFVCPCNDCIFLFRYIADRLQRFPILFVGKNIYLNLGKQNKEVALFVSHFQVANLYPVVHCQRCPEYPLDSCLRSRQIASPPRLQALRRKARCDQAFELELQSLTCRRYRRISW